MYFVLFEVHICSWTQNSGWKNSAAPNRPTRLDRTTHVHKCIRFICVCTCVDQPMETYFFFWPWQGLRGCAALVTSILRCTYLRRRREVRRPAATYRSTQTALAAWWRSTRGAPLPTKTDRYVCRQGFGFCVCSGLGFGCVCFKVSLFCIHIYGIYSLMMFSVVSALDEDILYCTRIFEPGGFFFSSFNSGLPALEKMAKAYDSQVTIVVHIPISHSQSTTYIHRVAPTVVDPLTYVPTFKSKSSSVWELGDCVEIFRRNIYIYHISYTYGMMIWRILIFPPRPLSLIFSFEHTRKPGTGTEADASRFENVNFEDNPLNVAGPEAIALAALGILGLLTFLPSCGK